MLTVITICYGAWDLRTFIESDEDGISKFARYSHQMLESIGAAIKKKTLEAEENGQEQECVQIVAISNMAGYSYRQMANMKGKIFAKFPVSNNIGTKFIIYLQRFKRWSIKSAFMKPTIQKHLDRLLS